MERVNEKTDAINDNEKNENNALSQIEHEFHEINKKNDWKNHYMQIRTECIDYNYTESVKPQNKLLNRYRDVAPYDHSRIILKRGPCDYINANLLKVEKANRQYILTQGPLPNTAGHFWLMVWEQNSKAIIMLNKVIERNQIKCHQYWPLEGSSCDTMMFPDVGLKVEFVSKVDKTEYVTRTLRLTDVESKESREILHFHYTVWPDFGVPQSPTVFLRFLVDVRSSGALDNIASPPIVHCSAGIGRTGTFCLVDTCLVLLEKNENNINLKDILMEMRKSRMGLIQTPDQLRFSYAAVIQGAKQLPSNNNIDNDMSMTNHYDEVTNSSIDEEDEPPPLPPPRGESLVRSNMMVVSTPSSESESEITEGLPNKPLPYEPSNCFNNLSSNNSMHINSTHDQNNEEDMLQKDLPSSPNSENAQSQVRQRHLEKTNRLATKVREMKRRQKQSEEWQRLKRSLFSPLSLGIGAAIAGGGVLAICGYLYLRG